MPRLRVVPIPAHSGFRAASAKIALLAWSTAARSSWSYVPCGMSSGVVKSGRIVRATALTAVRLATSPRRWPPMPSATIRSSRVRGSDRYAVWISMARRLSSSTGRTFPTFEANPSRRRGERITVSAAPLDPRVMFREVPFRVEDPDLGRTSEAFLRATLVARLVVPPNLNLLLDPAFLPQDDKVRKARGLLRPSPDRLGHVLRGRKPSFRIEGHGPRHHVGDLRRDAGNEVVGGSEEFRLPSRELFHRGPGILAGQEEEEDRTDAVQIARRS